MQFKITVTLHPNDVRAITPAANRHQQSRAVGEFVRELIDRYALSLLEDRAEEEEEERAHGATQAAFGRDRDRRQHDGA